MLIVDDEESILFAMREYFAAAYDVDCAGHLQLAAELLASRVYTVVIADLRLGDSQSNDGLDVIQLARSSSAMTQVVMLSAYASAELQMEASLRGAALFLQKPIPLREVGDMVGALVGRWA